MPKRRASGDFLCPGCHSKFDPETRTPFAGSCGHSLCAVCVNEKKTESCPVCHKEGVFPAKTAFTGFECPGCQSKFDHEIHVPFMGSCGHSLCGVCLDQKQIEDCFVCDKDGSFVSKQRNDLAIELLDEKAESKRPKMTEEKRRSDSREPISAILDVNNRPFLAQVVNALDPISFVNFARTCKEMYSYCFNHREIQITYDIPGLLALAPMSPGNTRRLMCKPGSEYADKVFRFLRTAENREKLQKYPFAFRWTLLMALGDVNSVLISKLRDFLAEIHVKKISRFMAHNIIDWDGLARLLKDFYTEDVWVDAVYGAGIVAETTPPISEEASVFLLQNMTSFRSEEYIRDSFILDAKTQRLHLKKATISRETFVDLLKRFAKSNEEILWKIGFAGFVFGHNGIFETLPYEYFDKEDTPIFVSRADKFWILRKDGKCVKCYSSEPNVVVFSTETLGYHQIFEYRDVLDESDAEVEEPEDDYDPPVNNYSSDSETDSDDDTGDSEEGGSDDESNDESDS